MFRLTFTLAAALYAGFVIWGTPVESEASATEAGTQQVARIGAERPMVLQTNASSRAEVTRTATVDPSLIVAATPAPANSFDQPALVGEPIRISLIEPTDEGAAEAAEEGAAAADPAIQLFRVTGSRVNLRSGPSTANGVVDSLVRGTVVEPVGEPVNGWQELRDVSTGVTGFMAARFLEPA
ncbi:SH3 domain-containing protein [Jannaschia aquimarina]|uniref:Bacterial SH3 domain protein n=1 Tax=Jannaschia aquimarina TaxID=935700 RepID=A0A0D1CT91_9RHOB|nr:SH3 domain-containing protein [Jannaschia aquimarina]KIT17987.1 Bacterial SH3 domain protein [Jannaschia aquimarina]SNS88023.1 SH3 domain-containing protein [Jannaschia aquimarina]